jgi:hypothetical protein
MSCVRDRPLPSSAAPDGTQHDQGGESFRSFEATKEGTENCKEMIDDSPHSNNRPIPHHHSLPQTSLTSAPPPKTNPVSRLPPASGSYDTDGTTGTLGVAAALRGPSLERCAEAGGPGEVVAGAVARAVKLKIFLGPGEAGDVGGGAGEAAAAASSLASLTLSVALAAASALAEMTSGSNGGCGCKLDSFSQLASMPATKHCRAREGEGGRGGE